MSVSNAISKIYNLPPSKLLGHVVTWVVPGGDRDIALVREALNAAGLDPKAAGGLTTEQAFSRGLAKLKKGRAIDKLAGDDIGYQVSAKKIHADSVEYTPECLVKLENDKVICANPQLELEIALATSKAECNRTASDLTRLIQRLFQKQAGLFPLNSKGVAYFVPGCHATFTESVGQFVSKIGGIFTKLPVPDCDDAAKASVKDLVSVGLQDLAKELDDAVSQWTVETRVSTADHAQKRLDALALKCEAYADYLGQQSEQVKLKIEETRKTIRAKVDELFAANDA